MNTHQVSRNTVITLSLVLLSVLASISVILLVDVPTGALFFLGYWVIAAISSVFKNRKYTSPRALA